MYHKTSVAITYFTKFSVVVITFYLKVLPADHRQPPFPVVNVLGEAIHPDSFLGSFAASKGCTANHGKTTDLQNDVTIAVLNLDNIKDHRLLSKQ